MERNGTDQEMVIIAATTRKTNNSRVMLTIIAALRDLLQEEDQIPETEKEDTTPEIFPVTDMRKEGMIGIEATTADMEMRTRAPAMKM